MKHILVTGATGLVGKKLITALQQGGYRISILSRRPVKLANISSFVWDVYRQTIDPDCLNGVDSIIHLAGENIAAGRWTEVRKKELIDSRVLSTQLLYKLIKESDQKIDTFISASAVGYYGDCGDEILRESNENGYGFLADCCKKWEDAVDQGKSLGIRIVKIRTGLVLDKDEGALSVLEKPIKYFAGAALGSGKQWVPWIHHRDLVNIYLHALENSYVLGSYNACAPFPVTNKTLTQQVAKELRRPLWPFNVPESLLKMVLGEMSAVVLMSNNTSAQKLLESGFSFNFTQLDEALKDIYR